jgi:hypothetical protein
MLDIGSGGFIVYPFFKIRPIDNKKWMSMPAKQ